MEQKQQQQTQESHKVDFGKLFNMNNILSQLINFAAYILLVLSIIILLYISFVDKFDIKIDWVTLGLFSSAVVILSWINWNTWYKRQYEKLMAEDIEQYSLGKYSIHSRYYFAIKDWDDVALQKSIDKFNDEYTAKWLLYVEKYTGRPIETYKRLKIDANGNPVLDSNGRQEMETIIGILDLPYKGFKHKKLMWQIKTHNYPQSGYTTSMEVMSLFSYQEANLNKRDLKGDKKFYAKKAVSKFVSALLTTALGGSLIPEMIGGNIWSAVFKLVIAIITLVTSIFAGATGGIRGARLKLSIVEETCADLERWAEKKPFIAPYILKETEAEQLTMDLNNTIDTQPVTLDIFNTQNRQNK